MFGDGSEGRSYGGVVWCVEEEGFDERVGLAYLSADPEPCLVPEVLVYGFYARYGAKGAVAGAVVASRDGP